MVLFPNCKINLGLHIVGKRPDGFHDLETIFYPLPLYDALELVHSKDGATTLQVTGITIDAHAEDNICIKAYRLIQQTHQIPPVQIHLHKNIPSGAGLGGGSADGAFMLQLLNKKFALGLSNEQLMGLSLQLGSDCPFFIYNQPCFAQGRGERLQPVTLDLSAYAIVLVNPKIHINTGWAFAQLQPDRQHSNLLQVAQQPIGYWKTDMTNDFEPPVFAAYPEIAKIKETLYDAGAAYASLTGTGSTVFALFDKNTTPAFHFPQHYFVQILLHAEG
ncbi:4-(cytidine 5'-diphospho)-2-C-methyl-D-erythritol kinase [Pseudocnuella soli]|uniref:4-(cytidine 5'-diphospho)-2-C-methyl-D-erythritol kinase n=1 Tax=Pseudocnuella soli TaxID=2502779 RepID=UPI00104EC390|nr:4-(cytidine 5'-diphospho)-2-C-methyl-D-erythritol kinase [Pseudocnuella soli]